MKREELKNLLGESATDGLIDKIMELHGKSVEKHKTDIAALTSERDGLKIQLVDAAALLRTNMTHPFSNRSCATVSNHFAESFPSPVLVSRPVLRYIWLTSFVEVHNLQKVCCTPPVDKKLAWMIIELDLP